MTDVISKTENTIDVRFNWLIYENPANHYSVASFDEINEDGEKTGVITCVGDIPQSKYIVYRMTGKRERSKYGEQFKVTSYIERLGSSKADVVGYLRSDMFKGVGQKKAESIYAAFGKDTFKVIENDPARLTGVRGITTDLAINISEAYKKNRNVVRLLALVKDCSDIGIKTCGKILEKFGDESEDIVKTDPFRLCEIKGIDFPTADAISNKFNLPKDDEKRMRAGAIYVLKQNELSGNLGMDLQDFGRALQNLLASSDITCDKINAFFKKALTDKSWNRIAFKKVWTDEIYATYVYRRFTYNAEVATANHIQRLMASSCRGEIEVEDKDIQETESKLGIKADHIQIEAVKTVYSNPVTIITGGPGTGKTTILKIITDIYEKKTGKNDILLMAPTGRAARKITEATGRGASTIHSRLKLVDTESADFVKEEDKEKIEESIVIIDEMSMVDIFLAKELFSAVQDGCRVILVGDADQLQSVGPGSVFRDFITSGVIPCVKLEHVFRQEDGCILANAEKIKNGETTLLIGRDFEINDGLSGEALEAAMIDAYIKDVAIYGKDNVVCLCPVKDFAAGVNAMNEKIQARLNPQTGFTPECKIGARIFRVGDLAMELRNGDVTSNGDIGTVTDVCADRGNESVTVRYFGTESVTYEGEDLSHLALAYAMTVHKAQGSEYDSVITCLQDKNYHMMKRNIPYTAITRGRKIVRYFGSVNALNKAIRTPETDKRKTLLGQYLAVQGGRLMEYAGTRPKAV